MKYVYLILSLENSYYKIGVSKHPNKRLKENQTGNPSPTKLLEVYQSELAYKIETALKNKYAHLKKEGEWFDLSITEEKNFIDDCKYIESNLKFLIENNNPFI